MHEISIIIPCHNVENYIDRCFESLKTQTIGLDKLQLIFVDDASTDGTRDKLALIKAQASSSVCVILLPQNIRQGGARNVGLEYATGSYIAFVDSDDWVEPDMYEQLYLAITKTESDLAFCRHVRDTGKTPLFLSDREGPATVPKETGKPDRLITISTPEERSHFIASNLLGQGIWDKLFRKDFLLKNEISFPPHLAYEDIPFSSLIYLYAEKVCIIEKRLYHYSVNENSTTLAKNKPHHRDVFQANYLKWSAYEERGVLNLYRQALEFDFIMTFYFTGFKIFCLRFDRILYDDFMVLKEETLRRVPDYRNNPYCHTHIPDFYRHLLTLLHNPVTQKDLEQLQQIFLKYHHLV